MSERSRRYCFTINNFTGTTLSGIKELEYSYIIVGEETGKGGTCHYQGYIEFKNAKTFSAVIKMFKKKAHVEICKGSTLQNKKYCSKGKVVLEEGTPSEQGKRNDLKAIKEIIVTGGTIKEMVENKKSGIIRD